MGGDNFFEPFSCGARCATSRASRTTSDGTIEIPTTGISIDRLFWNGESEIVHICDRLIFRRVRERR